MEVVINICCCSSCITIQQLQRMFPTRTNTSPSTISITTIYTLILFYTTTDTNVIQSGKHNKKNLIRTLTFIYFFFTSDSSSASSSSSSSSPSPSARSSVFSFWSSQFFLQSLFTSSRRGKNGALEGRRRLEVASYRPRRQ